jgi:prolyl-tRNA synthetase
MIHGDDDGIILPPKIASSHIVLLPIVRKESDRAGVMEYVETLKKELEQKTYNNRSIGVELDVREIGGVRGWDWIKRGIPLRVEVGPRDIAKDCVYIGRRDRDHKDRVSLKREAFVSEISNILDEIQQALFERALSFQAANTVAIGDKKTFYEFFTPVNMEKPEIHGGFALSGWCGSETCEAKIKEELSVTIRCIPFEGEAVDREGCVCCGRADGRRVVFAKAY